MIFILGQVQATKPPSNLKNTIQVEEIENKKVPTKIKTQQGGRGQDIVALSQSHNTEAKSQDVLISRELVGQLFLSG